MSDADLRAELYAAQRECAVLWDALVDARDVIDGALSAGAGGGAGDGVACRCGCRERCGPP